MCLAQRHDRMSHVADSACRVVCDAIKLESSQESHRATKLARSRRAGNQRRVIRQALQPVRPTARPTTIQARIQAAGLSEAKHRPPIAMHAKQDSATRSQCDISAPRSTSKDEGLQSPARAKHVEKNAARAKYRLPVLLYCTRTCGQTNASSLDADPAQGCSR